MKKMLIAAALAAAVYVPAHSYLYAPEPLIAYRVEVGDGDTIWALCARVASNRDNLQDVVSRAKKENGIADARYLQPGRKIVVRVKAVEK